MMWKRQCCRHGVKCRVQTAANHRLTGNRDRWIYWNRMTYIDWVQTKTTTRQINTVHHSLHEGREVHVDEGMEVGLPYFLRKPRWTPAVLMPAVVIAATGTEVRGRERAMLENRVRESDRERARERENNPHYVGLPSLNPCCFEQNWSRPYLRTHKHHKAQIIIIAVDKPHQKDAIVSMAAVTRCHVGPPHCSSLWSRQISAIYLLTCTQHMGDS